MPLSEEKLIKHLQTLRLDLGITQTGLSDRLGRPQSFVSKFENGERKLTTVEVFEILEQLNTEPLKELEKIYKKKT